MIQRARKRRGDGLRIALHRAHERIHGHEYEIGLLRRANESLSRRAELELSHARDRQNQMSEELRRLRRYLADVERLVGHYSIAAGDPKSMAIESGPHEFYLRGMSELPFRDLDQPFTDVDVVRSHHIIMKKLNVRTVRNHLQKVMHLRAALGNHEVAYSVSEQAMLTAPLEVILPRVAEEMTGQLFTSIRRHRARDRYDTFGDMESRRFYR
jgi:hypothetical protein